MFRKIRLIIQNWLAKRRLKDVEVCLELWSEAVRRFGGDTETLEARALRSISRDSKERFNDGIFNLAGFQTAYSRRYGPELSEGIARECLSRYSSIIVPLKGGSHFRARCRY